MISPRPHEIAAASMHARLRAPRRRPRSRTRGMRLLACTLAVVMTIGCEPAQSSSSSNDTMFGLFKSKSPSTVDPAVGAALVREAAFPAAPARPPAASYGQPQRLALDAAPPAGKLSPNVDGQSPAEAWLTDAKPVALALVNVFEPKRRCELWMADKAGHGRLTKQVPLRLDANQEKWSACSAQEVLALPGGKLLVLLRYRLPNPVDALYLLDDTGVARNFGIAQPDWLAGLPSRFLDNLQLTPDTVLVDYRTDSVRLGAERYVNRFDHLVVFSPRHPNGLEVARIGIDDGNVRDWRFINGKLWLQTSDTRGDGPRHYNWSLDLTHIL